MGIEPTRQLVTGALVLKTRRPTRTWHFRVYIMYAMLPGIVNVTMALYGLSTIDCCNGRSELTLVANQNM